MHPKQSRAKDLFLQGYTFQEIGAGMGLAPATLRKWARAHQWHEQKAAAARRRLQLEDLSSRLHGILQQQMDYLYYHTYNGQLPEGPAACYRNLTESLANVHKVLALSTTQPVLHLPPPTDTPKRKTRKQVAAEVTDETQDVTAALQALEAPLPQVDATHEETTQPVVPEEAQGDVAMQSLDSEQPEETETSIETAPETTSQPAQAPPVLEVTLTAEEATRLLSPPRLNHKARRKARRKAQRRALQKNWRQAQAALEGNDIVPSVETQAATYVRGPGW